MSDVHEPAAHHPPATEGGPGLPEQEGGGEGRDHQKGRDDRRGDAGGRRAADVTVARGPAQAAWAFAWALVGAIVVLYLFFLAIGGVDPDDAPAVSIAVLVLAVLWFAHAWRRVIGGGRSPIGDRERRGF